MGGFFWGGGYKGEGSNQNMENYGLEVPTKPLGLYLVPKLRFFFLDFRGLGVLLGVKGVGSIHNEGNYGL